MKISEIKGRLQHMEEYFRALGREKKAQWKEGKSPPYLGMALSYLHAARELGALNRKISSRRPITPKRTPKRTTKRRK